jgi:hypothetical protein
VAFFLSSPQEFHNFKNMNIQSFNKQATAAGEKGLIFFHLKPLKSVCQSKRSTRPPQTTGPKYHRLMEIEKAWNSKR